MANTTISTANVNVRHLNKTIREAIHASRFKEFRGTGMDAIFCVKEQAVTGRQTISIPLVTRLTNGPRLGSQTLNGSEEAYGNFADVLVPTYRRHAVAIDKEEADKPNFDAVGEVRPLLSNWNIEDERDQYIESLGAFLAGTTYANYGDATEANKDTWLAANTDRVLFGDGSLSPGLTDHSADLGLVTAGMTMSADIVSRAKRIARNSDRHIRPVGTRVDDDYYVMFVNQWQMRDLRNDSVMEQANRDARARNMQNPIFRGGDLMYDNVLIREIPEMNSFVTTTGAASAAVAPAFLCGAQAVGHAIGSSMRFTSKKEDDYDFITGVGLEKKEHVKKLYFDGKQNGTVNVYTASAAD